MNERQSRIIKQALEVISSQLELIEKQLTNDSGESTLSAMQMVEDICNSWEIDPSSKTVSGVLLVDAFDATIETKRELSSEFIKQLKAHHNYLFGDS